MSEAALRHRRGPLLGAGLVALGAVLALGACVIGPKPEDPAEDRAPDAGVADTSTAADTEVTTSPEAGVVSDADAGAGGDGAGDAASDAADATDGATDAVADATDAATDGG
ncbi:MAG: hypothetical protein IPJ34_30940 [Myxococcales bacterium]|nr:hypothetical protein [Myxococcales bacterium]